LRDVGVVGDIDVEHRPRPLLRFVADSPHLTVGHEPQHALDVAQLRDAQVDALDRTDGIAHVDDVAHAELVLDDHEGAGRDVLDQLLEPESEGDAEETGAEAQPEPSEETAGPAETE